jgi:hypothetical protein
VRCKLALAAWALALAGYAGWRYYDWAVNKFDVQEPA